MIAESLLIIMLFSCGASGIDADGISHHDKVCAMEASGCDGHAIFPISVIPLYKSTECVSGKNSLISTNGASLQFNKIQCSNSGSRNTALNFLSTRLIL